jgi:AmmeMemoRadiSam system protein B
MNQFDSVRKPAVAGSFYPRDPHILKKQITDMLAKARKPQFDELAEGRILGLIVPHAGYVYSGQIAAYGYKLIEGNPIRTAVVISPSHMEFFQFASVYSGDAYQTPLGMMPVDHTLADKIASQHPLIQRSDRGHMQDHLPQREHALEVQLPFLQSVFGDLGIVPIVMGDQSWEVCEALGNTLASVIRQKDVLAVASSDLSHFHSYEEAERLDGNFRNILEKMDPEALFKAVRRNECEACGAGPVIAAMIAGLKAGAVACRILQAANSGDVSGDRHSVVGYTSAALIGGQRVPI